MKTTLKVVSKKTTEQEADSSIPTKVSLEDLRRIWTNEQHSYTDEELIKIRDWLYTVAKIMISVSQKMEKEYLLIKQQQIKENETAQSYPICQSEYRRAS